MSRIRKRVKCRVETLLGEIRIYFGDDAVEVTAQQAIELSDILAQAADAAMDFEACKAEEQTSHART